MGDPRREAVRGLINNLGLMGNPFMSFGGGAEDITLRERIEAEQERVARGGRVSGKDLDRSSDRVLDEHYARTGGRPAPEAYAAVSQALHQAATSPYHEWGDLPDAALRPAQGAAPTGNASGVADPRQDAVRLQMLEELRKPPGQARPSESLRRPKRLTTGRWIDWDTNEHRGYDQYISPASRPPAPR